MFTVAKAAIASASTLDAEAMAAINRYTHTPLDQADVYVFSTHACDDQPDRDGERFTAECLAALAPLFVGKPMICDHNWSAASQVARIYRAETIKEGAVTVLRLDVYMLRNAETQPVIDKIEAGILKEVSIGCAITKATCSVCGKPYSTCVHERGRSYDGKTCVVELSEPTDAYEVSFVAVPAQPAAGVCKAAKPENDKMSTMSLDDAKRRLRLEKYRY